MSVQTRTDNSVRPFILSGNPLSIDGATVTGGAATSAVKTGGAGAYVLDAGDTAVIDVDNAGNATATFDAAAGTITDNTTYAVTDQDGLTSLITVDGGEQQVVTFSGATTTALQVAAQMNAQLKGCSVDGSSGQVVITSDTQGTGSSVAAAAGTGGLTWDAAVAGTGDVVNIKEVTSAEVKTVIENDTTAEVTVVGSGFTISSPTTGLTSELDFISGDALTPLGFSVETINGTAAGSGAIAELTLMVQDPATRQWAPMTDISATDGTEKPRGIIENAITEVSLQAGNVLNQRIIVDGSFSFDEDMITIQNSLTLDSIIASEGVIIRSWLTQMSMVPEKTSNLTQLENS